MNKPPETDRYLALYEQLGKEAYRTRASWTTATEWQAQVKFPPGEYCADPLLAHGASPWQLTIWPLYDDQRSKNMVKSRSSRK